MTKTITLHDIDRTIVALARNEQGEARWFLHEDGRVSTLTDLLPAGYSPREWKAGEFENWASAYGLKAEEV